MVPRYAYNIGMRDGQQINRISVVLMLALSVIALVTVLSGYLQKPLPDEGAAAHIFQLAIAAIGIVGLVFLATADWSRPWQITRLLFIPAGVVIFAFTALYYLEHYR